MVNDRIVRMSRIMTLSLTFVIFVYTFQGDARLDVKELVQKHIESPTTVTALMGTFNAASNQTQGTTGMCVCVRGGKFILYK